MFEIYKLEDDRTGVKIIGEIDISTVEVFQNPIQEMIEGDDKQIYLDVTDLKYIDSTGIGILIELRKESIVKKQEIILINPQKNVMKLLQLTGVDKIFNIREEN
ncbi:MAG: STAS domain-containing protein [Eubacterium sp.]